MKYLNIKTGDIPGVEVSGDAAYAELGGQWFPVVALLPDKKRGMIPILNIPQMSDKRWNEIARSRYLERYEQEHGEQNDFPEAEYCQWNAEERREFEQLVCHG